MFKNFKYLAILKPLVLKTKWGKDKTKGYPLKGSMVILVILLFVKRKKTFPLIILSHHFNLSLAGTAASMLISSSKNFQPFLCIFGTEIFIDSCKINK